MVMRQKKRPNPNEYNDWNTFHTDHVRAGYERDGRCQICWPALDEDQIVSSPAKGFARPIGDEDLTQPHDTHFAAGGESRMSPAASNKLNVGMLMDGIHQAMGGGIYFNNTTETNRHRKYGVVAVLNPNDGPDEVLLIVRNLTWDHSLGVLRLEVEE